MDERMFLNKPLQQDNVYPEVFVKSLGELTKLPVKAGKENAVLSGGKIVNIVSKQYGLLPNQRFFLQVEQELRDADIQYVKRAINRNDCSFSVDYILKDDRYHVSVKRGNDIIVPMLRFTNSYDGTCKTSGNFGFWRQVCSNGLHVATTKVGFSLKHRGNVCELVLPHIEETIAKFLDNEFYQLQRKFEVLAERRITDLSGFVKLVCDKTGLFKFESSEKNPEPGLNARMVIETVQREATEIGTQPNLWLGYNAFNELLHGKLKKTFEQQRVIDGQLLDTVLSLS